MVLRSVLYLLYFITFHIKIKYPGMIARAVRHMCTLSFHRHFNYYKSATTRTRDSVTIISLTRASDWSLALVWSSDWLSSRHPWLRYHGTRTEVTRGLSSDSLVLAINIVTSPPSFSRHLPIPHHQRRQVHCVLG